MAIIIKWKKFGTTNSALRSVQTYFLFLSFFIYCYVHSVFFYVKHSLCGPCKGLLATIPV